MYPEETAAVDQAFAYLSQAIASPPRRPSNNLTVTHVEAIIQILDRWPSSQRFPGALGFVPQLYIYGPNSITVIDLSRLLTGYCPDAFSTPGLRDRFFEALFKASEWTASWTVPLSKAKETNILLLFRTLANAFQEGTPIGDGTWVGQVNSYLRLYIYISTLYSLTLFQVFEALSQAPYASLTKAQRVALATILFKSVYIPLQLFFPCSHILRYAVSRVLLFERLWIL